MKAGRNILLHELFRRREAQERVYAPLGDMLPEAAGQVEMTFYVVAMPEQSGKMSNDFRQLGESFPCGFRTNA